jgi:hypothetical protein
MGFWDTTATTAGPLTEEVFRNAMEAMKTRDDRQRLLPRGPCGCTACLVSPTTKTRLETEGGMGRCANCFAPFWIDPPS